MLLLSLRDRILLLQNHSLDGVVVVLYMGGMETDFWGQARFPVNNSDLVQTLQQSSWSIQISNLEKWSRLNLYRIYFYSWWRRSDFSRICVCGACSYRDAIRWIEDVLLCHTDADVHFYLWHLVHFFRRLSQGKNVLKAHREHLYHLMNRYGFSRMEVLLVRPARLWSEIRAVIGAIVQILLLSVRKWNKKTVAIQHSVFALR